MTEFFTDKVGLIVDKQKGQETISGLKNTIRFHRGLSAVLSLALVCILLLSFFILMSTRTIIVPPGSTTNYIVGSDLANEPYLADMSKYIINLMFNVTPANVDENFSAILKMADSSTYGEVKKYLDATAKRIKEQQITSVFSSTGSYQYYPNKRQIVINGEVKNYLADKLVDNTTKRLAVNFTIKSGQFKILNIQQVVDNNESK